MVDKVDIENNLIRLDKEYGNYAADTQMSVFFSKLAVIEFCGWIEESFDAILKNYVSRHIVIDEGRKIILGFIKQNHGFKYNPNMYKIFSIVLGSDNWENVLDRLSQVEMSVFTNVLSYYSEKRNDIAHTYVKGTTTIYTAPSKVLSDFKSFFPSISKIDKEVLAL